MKYPNNVTESDKADMRIVLEDVKLRIEKNAELIEDIEDIRVALQMVIDTLKRKRRNEH